MTDQELNEAVARKLGIELGNLKPRDYSTSIEAAWEVVEYLNKTKFHCCQLNVDGLNVKYGFWIGDRHSQKFFGEADTAPRAICLAFLKSRELL